MSVLGILYLQRRVRAANRRSTRRRLNEFLMNTRSRLSSKTCLNSTASINLAALGTEKPTMLNERNPWVPLYNPFPTAPFLGCSISGYSHSELELADVLAAAEKKEILNLEIHRIGPSLQGELFDPAFPMERLRFVITPDLKSCWLDGGPRMTSSYTISSTGAVISVLLESFGVKT